MTAPFQTARILLSQIDLADTRFKLSPGLPPPHRPSPLKDSIARTGIIHPPILKKTGGEVYLVVSGHNRIKTAHGALKQKSFTCLALPPEIPDCEALAVALEAILIKRQPTPMERANFFKKILLHMDEQDAAARFLPLFSLPPGPYHVRHSLALTGLEEPLAIALHNGFLNESVAQELLKLPFTDRLALFEIMDLLHLSVSNQKKLTNICTDLARRLDVSIIKLLMGLKVQEIVNHPGANPPQKTAKLMQALTEKQYPRSSLAEKEFQHFSAGLHLPKGASLSHTPSFEDDTVTLTLNFRNKEELEKRWPALAAAIRQPDFS